MNSRTDRIFRIALIAAFALPLLAHMLVGSYTRMMADDFCTSYLGRTEGLIGGFIVQYNTWAGQPSNILLKNAVGIIGMWVIPLLPSLVIVSWMGALMWTLEEIFKGLRPPRWILLLAAAAYLFAIFDGSPLIIQSLYWLAAVIPYTMPLVVATVYVGFLARVLQSEKPIGTPTLLLSAILCFIAGGFSENYIVVQLGALLAGIAICVLLPSPRLRQRALPVLIAGLVGTALVLVIILAAPGNTVRRAGFPPPPSVLTIVTSGTIQTIAFIVVSLTSFSPVGALITVIVSAYIAYCYSSRATIPITPFHALAFLMFLFLPVAAYVAAGVYATGGALPPARSYIIPQTHIVGALALAGYTIGSQLKARGAFRHASRVGQSIAVVLIVALVILGPVRAAAQTLQTLPAFQVFATEFDQREQYITAARGETTLTVAPLTVDVGERVGLETIGADPEFWVNGCAARYYGLEAIVAE